MSGGSRGSVSVEVAILAPAFVALIMLAALVGRVSVAQGAVTIAAHDAARAASISRDATTASQRAEEVARTTLEDQGLACQTLDIDPLVDGFSEPVGQPAQVEVTVSCLVSPTGAAGFGLIGNRLVTATFASPLDTWRDRS